MATLRPPEEHTSRRQLVHASSRLGWLGWLVAALSAVTLAACEADTDPRAPSATARESAQPNVPEHASGDRLASIPANATKVSPETDPLGPILQLAGWARPMPVPGPVTSAGAEDSPFISPDGSELFFFFTPNPGIPAEEQLTDRVTGIWNSQLATDGSWSEPSRVVLHDDLSLDGCETLHEHTLWFCSVRAGNLREIDIYTATREGRDGTWGNVTSAGEHLNLTLVVGEMHITTPGDELYFHRPALPGETGAGGVDLWVTHLVEGKWAEAENLGGPINTAGDDMLPFVSTDGRELWFTGPSRLGYQGPSVFRSLRLPAGGWGDPVEVVSQFAAEPTLDDAGNLYFTHHYFAGDGSPMIEADIYVALRAPE